MDKWLTDPEKACMLPYEDQQRKGFQRIAEDMKKETRRKKAAFEKAREIAERNRVRVHDESEQVEDMLDSSFNLGVSLRDTIRDLQQQLARRDDEMRGLREELRLAHSRIARLETVVSTTQEGGVN